MDEEFMEFYIQDLESKMRETAQAMCSHPKEKVRAKFLSFEIDECEFLCECGKKLKISGFME